jgi:hypothetical protein
LVFGLSIPIPTLFNIVIPDTFKLDEIVVFFHVVIPDTFNAESKVALL